MISRRLFSEVFVKLGHDCGEFWYYLTDHFAILVPTKQSIDDSELHESLDHRILSLRDSEMFSQVGRSLSALGRNLTSSVRYK